MLPITAPATLGLSVSSRRMHILATCSQACLHPMFIMCMHEGIHTLQGGRQCMSEWELALRGETRVKTDIRCMARLHLRCSPWFWTCTSGWQCQLSPHAAAKVQLLLPPRGQASPLGRPSNDLHVILHVWLTHDQPWLTMGRSLDAAAT